MRKTWVGLAVALTAAAPAVAEDGPLPEDFDQIETIVVVYQKNRSFVHLLPESPGAGATADAPEAFAPGSAI